MNREELLARFSRGTLGEAERRELFEAALDDQALFDALAEEDALREVLDHPSSRSAVRARLKPASAPARAVRWRIPAAVAASLAAALAVILLRSPAMDMIGAARPPTPEALALWSEADTAAKGLPPIEAHLDVAPGASGPGRFRPGETILVDVRLSEAAWVALLLRPPDGAPRQLFPDERFTARIAAPGMRVTAPRGRPLAAPARPGRYQLRLMAVREAAGPLDAHTLRTAVAAGEAAIVDVAFDVTAP